MAARITNLAIDGLNQRLSGKANISAMLQGYNPSLPAGTAVTARMAEEANLFATGLLKVLRGRGSE